MSRRMAKTLGILLAVCFLMSVAAAAVSADPCDNSSASQKYAKGMQGKELMKGKPIVIRNLIIAKNVVIIYSRTKHPLLRAAVLKGMMTKKGMMKENKTMGTGTSTSTNEESYTTTENTTAKTANSTGC